MLETGVGNAARRIYTGQFQQDNAGDRSDPHRRQVPRRDLQEHRRPDQLRQDPDRRPHPRLLPGQKPQKPITADGQFDSANFGKYEPPGANQIVVVRAAVEYPVFVSLLNPNQSNLQNGNRLIMGTAAFRTEPFAQ